MDWGSNYSCPVRFRGLPDKDFGKMGKCCVHQNSWVRLGTINTYSNVATLGGDPTFGYGGSPLPLLLPQANPRIIRVVIVQVASYRGEDLKVSHVAKQDSSHS